MKNTLFFVLVSLSPVAFTAPIFCGEEGNPYQLVVNSDHKSADLKINEKEVEFGHLVCEPIEGAIELALRCQSPYVADAGYHATVSSIGNATDFAATIFEESFIGAKEIASLRCVAAMNSPR